MGGGLLQLVAYGAQDAYISGNPQITFWKGLFKRHTNFAMEPFRINFTGQVQWGTKQTALVGRHADLLYSTYVEVTLPQTVGGDTVPFLWNNEAGALGYNLIKHVEIDIGGQVVDRMYSEFMFLWGNLTQNFTQSIKLGSLLSGPCTDIGPSVLRYGTACAPDGRQQKMNVIYIPLPFFFTRNPGAALPLIALQYHEVKINVLWNETQFIAGNFNQAGIVPPAIQAALYIDYIYLDTEERRRMAQASHEYLIEQTQFNEDKGIRGANSRIDLTFNHPVKELIWVVQPTAYTDCRLAAAVERPYTFTVNEEIHYTRSLSADTTVPIGFTSPATFEFEFSQSGSLIATKQNSGIGYNVGDVLTFYQSRFGSYAAGNIEIQVTSVTGDGEIDTFYIKSGRQRYVPETRLKPFTYDIDPVFDQLLQINGQDRLDRRHGDYFSMVQPYQHHSGTLGGGLYSGLFGEHGGGLVGLVGGGAYMYSFALRPEEHQPSGTCNFSRIDTATIVMNMAGLTSSTLGGDFGFNETNKNNDVFNDWNVRVYATNYNVLRVMSGMGGLAYSN